MAQGLFTLRQQVQGIVQKAWNTPVGTYAGSFNGSSQYLTTTMTGQTFGTGDFTVEFWVNPASVATSDIIDTRSAGDSINAYSVQFDGTNLNWANTANYLSVPVSNFPLGTWTHVAYTRVSGTMKVYVNGTQYGSSITLASDYTNTRLDIGIAVRTYYFSGLISNIRLVRGTAVYTSNFAPPKAALTAVSGTALLTLQNATIIDNSTNAFTITNTGSVTTGAAMPFTQLKTPAVDYLVVAGGGGGGNGNAGGGGGAGGLLQGTVPVTAGSAITVTVGSGGAGGAQSLSDNTLAGSVGQNSVFGNISATGGGGGGASGVSSSSGGSGGGSGGSTNNQVGGSQGIAGQGNKGGMGTNLNYPKSGGGGGAGTFGQDYYYNASGPQFSGNGGAGIASAISGTVSAYSGGGGGGGDYRGTTVTTATTGGTGGGGAGSLTTTGTNGTANTGGGGGGGGLSLSPTTFYAGGTGGSGIVIMSYPDIYAGAAATTGSPTVSTSGSGSISLNGTSAYFTYNGQSSFAFGTNSFTIEGWFYFTNVTTTQILYDFRATSVNGSNPVVYISSGLVYYYPAGSVAITGTTTLVTNTWYHIALCRSSTSTNLYVNGVQQGSTYSDSTNYAVGASRPLIGASGFNNGTGQWLGGYISNLRMVNGTAVYTSAFTPPTSPLTAITNTSLLLSTVSGAYIQDSSTNSYTPTTTAGSPAWNQLSPFATGLGYKNRVYTWNSSGSITF